MNRCCDDYTGECNQGRDCPARTAKTQWCATSRQPCTQPYTCASACQLGAANSDGSPHSTEVWELTPLGWAMLACLIVGVTAAFYFF